MKKQPRCQHGVPLDEFCGACGPTPSELPFTPWVPVGDPRYHHHEPIDMPLFAPGSDTSKAAAKKVQPSVSDLVRQVYDAIMASGLLGLTTDEVMGVLGKGPEWKNTIAPRITDLKQQGLIVDTGRTRPSNRGGPMAVFVVKSKDHEDPRA